MARKLIVEIVGDSRSYERAMGRSTKASKSFGTSVTGMSKSASLGFGSIIKASAGFIGVTSAINAVSSALRAGIDEYTQMVTVAAQTEAVLKSTGGAANVTAKDVQTLATSLSQLSGVDDEAIASAENLILTFKNVRNTTGEGNRIFDRATLAALDLSKAAGGAFGDLPTTAKQLAKALNDPVRGMTALGRAGVTFSATQKELIKRLVESGQVLNAQKIILREVESQVGGSAKAFGETLPGQLAKLRESFRNTFGEIIAAAVPPLRQELVPVLQQAAEAVRKWAGDSENQARIQQQVRTAIDAVTAAAKTFKGIFDAVAPIIERVAKAIGGTENSVRLLVAVMATAKVYGFVTAITGLGTAALTSTGRVNALRLALLRLRLLGPIAILVTVVVYRKQINEAGRNVNRWLNDALPGSPFGGGLGIEIPFTVGNLSKLVLARAALARIRGEDDARVVVLDKIIARLREIEKERKSKLTVDVEYVVKVTGDPIPGDLPGERPGMGTTSSGGGGATSAKTAAQTAAEGNAVIARITRQAAAATASLNRQLADSEKRAAHLRDLIRADPSNVTLQKRLTAELQKQSALRAEMADVERESVENAREALRLAIETRKEREAARKAAVQRGLFKALGLTEEGEKPTPGSGSLLKRAQSMLENLKGTALDTKKNRQQLRRIIAVLKKNFKNAGQEVRAAILQMLNDISGAGSDAEKKGPLTKTSGLNTKKILLGMGLSPEEERELRGRLSSLGSGTGLATPGGGAKTRKVREGGFGNNPIFVESHTTINLDGNQVARVVTRQQQVMKRRNPSQKRGPHGGR